MLTLTIRELPIEELLLAPYNPRRPLSATAHRKLRRSIAEFGLVEPLIWNERTGHIVGGHARVKILRELGYTCVPVSVVSLDADRERALNVMLNNQEAQGRYDTAKLLEVLEHLGDDRDLTGFDDAMIRSLRFEPLTDIPEESRGDSVEITFVVAQQHFEQFSTNFDVLVREFDLVTHIKKN